MPAGGLNQKTATLASNVAAVANNRLETMSHDLERILEEQSKAANRAP